jgi:hypothetical protein
MATEPVYPGHLTREAHIRTKHLSRHSRYLCAMRLNFCVVVVVVIIIIIIIIVIILAAAVTRAVCA